MVPVIDIACVRVGRLDIKHVEILREARVDGRTPLPLHGYARYSGAKDTAPVWRNTAARQARRHWEPQTGQENFIASLPEIGTVVVQVLELLSNEVVA